MIDQETALALHDGDQALLDGKTPVGIASVMLDLGVALIRTDDAFGLHVVTLDRLEVIR